VRAASEAFDRIFAFATARGKPWAIGEIGSCPVNGGRHYCESSLSQWC
jgi:hypothetical protein